MNSSALVETVSVNYEDFNETFLTCGTCLCMYNGEERTPKLLACSHTVCRSCLESIIQAAASADGRTFRCPICRETIVVPQGGVGALPPSFLINQLLDLMAQQRREIVPKCPTHLSQELLFCESCDVIFCMLCQGGDHGGNHNVIPFSIAIKRMSEILLYKASQCVQTLDEAHQNVSAEMHQLERSTQEVIEQINSSFEEAERLLSSRKERVLSTVYQIHKEKRQNLQEQLQLIGSEKSKVEANCQGAESETEVRHITKKIVDVNERLCAAGTLADPRDNAFMQYLCEGSLRDLGRNVDRFGRVKVSTTFPPLCRLTPAFEEAESAAPAVVHLESRVLLTTVDYRGNERLSGGDPVTAEVTGPDDAQVRLALEDVENGTYDMRFTPSLAGVHRLDVRVFGRAVRGSPFEMNATTHVDPVCQLGSRGAGHLEFEQPTDVARDPATGRLYVLDTGNCRIKVLGADGSLHGHLLENAGTGGGSVGGSSSPMEGRGCTGIAWTPSGTLVTVNWRTRLITELSGDDGRIVKMFTSPELSEPTAVAVSPSTGDVVVVDNGARALIVFDSAGRLARRLDYASIAVPCTAPPLRPPSGGVENKENGSMNSVYAPAAPLASQRPSKGKGILRRKEGAALKKRKKETDGFRGSCSDCVSVASDRSTGASSPVPTGLSHVSGIAVTSTGPEGADEIVVACDSLIAVLDASDGRFMREVGAAGDDAQQTGRRKKGASPGGKYAGLTVDEEGTILATKTEKGRSTVEVFRRRPEGGEEESSQELVHFSIDSFSHRLKRPSGLVPVAGHKVVVCDLGNDCIKTYRYK